MWWFFFCQLVQKFIINNLAFLKETVNHSAQSILVYIYMLFSQAVTSYLWLTVTDHPSALHFLSGSSVGCLTLIGSINTAGLVKHTKAFKLLFWDCFLGQSQTSWNCRDYRIIIKKKEFKGHTYKGGLIALHCRISFSFFFM